MKQGNGWTRPELEKKTLDSPCSEDMLRTFDKTTENYCICNCARNEQVYLSLELVKTNTDKNMLVNDKRTRFECL